MFETPYKNAKIKPRNKKHAVFAQYSAHVTENGDAIQSCCILVWNQRIKVNFKCLFYVMLCVWCRIC